MGTLIILSTFTSEAHSQTSTANFSSYSVSTNSVIVFTGSGALRFAFYQPGIVRVDYLFRNDTSAHKSIVVTRSPEQTVAFRVLSLDSSFSIVTDSLRITCSKYPVKVEFFDRANELILRDLFGDSIITSGSRTTARFSIRPDEQFYGSGERGTSFDLRGLAFDSFNEQHGGYPVGGIPPTMNINVPFLVSTKHYGIYFDDTYKGHFDIGHARGDRLDYTAYGGRLSYFFMYAPTMAGVLSDYTWLTGRAPLLPRWAYGYIQSKFGYRNEADAEQMIRRMRHDRIPCDAIILDLYWFKNMGDLSWNTSSWPDPSRIVSSFLTQGFKTIVITEPYITRPSLNFAYADSMGYLVKDSLGQSYIMKNWWSCNCDAGLLDITNPSARQWWWSKYDSIFNTGVSGLWTDLGEPERDYPDMRFYGGPDLKVHNLYDFMWARTLFDGLRRNFPNRRMFNLTRSGYAGIQRFGVVTWSGDVAKTFGGLAVQLPILMNMGMSGIAYHNSDIGGFTNGRTTPELYTRWMEFGTFCPVMRAHGYDVYNPTEPWGFGTRTQNIVRKFIRLRYSLLPYNYTMAHETYETGIPLARPLVLEDPGNPNVRKESSAYMWGEDFLVAPVVRAGQRTKTFYLPPGGWIDYWNDRLYRGGKEVTVAAPLDEVPLFVKSSCIIPMMPPPEYIRSASPDTLILSIYPSRGAHSDFSLYEDDGQTLDYQHGDFSSTLFTVTTSQVGKRGKILVSIGAAKGSYKGKPVNRFYICEIHRISGRPRGVSLQGSSLPFINSENGREAPGNGYRYNRKRKTLDIWIQGQTKNSYEITIDGAKLSGE